MSLVQGWPLCRVCCVVACFHYWPRDGVSVSTAEWPCSCEQSLYPGHYHHLQSKRVHVNHSKTHHCKYDKLL